MIILADVKIQMQFKGQDGETFKKILSYINPNCDNATLRNFVDSLNGLTTNRLEDVFKIVEKFLSDSGEEYISVEDIKKILDGDFTPSADDNPISSDDLQDILDGEFTPAEDDNPLDDDDFIF